MVSKSFRNSGARRTRMSYSLSSSRRRVGTMPSTMPRSCIATEPTSKPRSAARLRFTSATISGWPVSSVLSTSTAPGTALAFCTTSSLRRSSSAMSSPRRNTLSGAWVGAPCMNSGSATVIFSSGICLRRPRMSSFSSAMPRSRSCFLPVLTRSDAFNGLPSKPTVVKICRTSGISFTTASTSSTYATVCSNAVPAGTSTFTANSPRSSCGTNSVPMIDSVDMLARNTTVAVAMIFHGCAIAHSSSR